MQLGSALRMAVVLVVGLAVSVASCSTMSRGDAPTVTREEGLAAFETVRAVLQHPRCVNCHPAGNVPLQHDAGVPHSQFVVRGADGMGAPGMQCSACHGPANPPASYGAHVPPGVVHWRMPPERTPMVFQDKSSAELARALADPQQNGGKSLAQLVEHVRSDPLVLWGWSPGGDRTPVGVSHDAFVAAFATWVAAGAPSGE